MSTHGTPADDRAGGAWPRLRLAVERRGLLLSRDEQKAVWIVLALFLLGLTVRAWHMHHRTAPAAPTPATERPIR
jgi:hypothetical protein